MPQANTQELGIVILPDATITSEAKDLTDKTHSLLQHHGLDIKKIINTPHVSLFQFVIENDKLAQVENRLKTITQHFHTFTIEMDSHLTDTQHNIFWNATKAKRAPAFVQLQNEVIQKINPLRSKEVLLKQIAARYKNLSSDKKQLVDQFGVFYFAPAFFMPHITLVYNSGTDRNNINGELIKIADVIKSIAPTHNYSFTIKQLALVKLGLGGNIEKVLTTFSLTPQSSRAIP